MSYLQARNLLRVSWLFSACCDFASAAEAPRPTARLLALTSSLHGLRSPLSRTGAVSTKKRADPTTGLAVSFCIFSFSFGSLLGDTYLSSLGSVVCCLQVIDSITSRHQHYPCSLHRFGRPRRHSILSRTINKQDGANNFHRQRCS